MTVICLAIYSHYVAVSRSATIKPGRTCIKAQVVLLDPLQRYLSVQSGSVNVSV